jgi:hypothetical protein
MEFITMLARLPHELPHNDQETENNEKTSEDKARSAKALSSAPAVLHEEERLRSHLHYYANRGRQYHNKGAIKKAADSFAECIRISKLLLFSNQRKGSELSGIELLFMASHNMAACCNQLRSASHGETILRELYVQVVSLCDGCHLSRQTRLEALSVLDKSLFSLASQMAYMGQTSEIQELIYKTESFAENVSKKLRRV